jgi:N-acetylglucosamine kinase-like BadF-type ATPase
MTTAELAPFVFEAAQLGDAVCLAILEEAGQALGHAAAVVAKRCFQPEEAFGLVLGGSVFQHGVVDTMRRALISRIRREFREVTVQTLDHPPLCGAVLLALDTLMNTATETVEPAALAAALEGRT